MGRSLTRALGFSALALGVLSVVPAARPLYGQNGKKDKAPPPKEVLPKVPDPPRKDPPKKDPPGPGGNVGNPGVPGGQTGGFFGRPTGFTGNATGFGGNFQGLGGNNPGMTGASGGTGIRRPGPPQLGGHDVTFTGIHGVYGIQGGTSFSAIGFLGNSGINIPPPVWVQPVYPGNWGFNPWNPGYNPWYPGYTGFHGPVLTVPPVGFTGFQGVIVPPTGYAGFQGYVGMYGMVGKPYGFAGASGF